MAGKLSDGHLYRAVTEASAAVGDFAEIGVWKGHTFARLARYARAQGRLLHAFDSFQGLAEPGPNDGKELRRGQFSSGGEEGFRALMRSAQVPDAAYDLHQGWIPECFIGSEDLRFAFAYLDVDHCEPTKAAIDWLWPRLSPGGVLGFDDYFPGREIYASPPIDEFIRTTPHERLWFEANQLFIRKET